jgi:hypothetical protein
MRRRVPRPGVIALAAAVAACGGHPPGGGGNGTGSCLGSDLLASLGKSHLLVGFSGDDAVATQAQFDLRYLYLAGGLPDGTGPCASCAAGCASGGQSCANSNPNGCAWWGCWQYDRDPPGSYATGFMGRTRADGEIPMFTYYLILQASRVAEGSPEVTVAARDAAFMARYLADWRFALQKIGGTVALLHLEPDFWGYAQQLGSSAHALPAAVASANPGDCAEYEDSIAGLGRCMIHMARKYAVNAKVGLHASGWATGVDVLYNDDPSLDVAGQAVKVGAFLRECGAADGDFVVVEMSDRDAGWYQLGAPAGQRRNAWWDATNATLPSFHQDFTWARALAESVGKPLLWWQVPLGNMGQNDTAGHWKDNRVQYFFDHSAELAQAHGFGIAFGPGADAQTTPSTDGSYLVDRTRAHAAAGGTPLCQ